MGSAVFFTLSLVSILFITNLDGAIKLAHPSPGNMCQLHVCNSTYKKAIKCVCDLSCRRVQWCCFNYFDEKYPNNIPKSVMEEVESYRCHDFDNPVRSFVLRGSDSKADKGYSLISKCNASGRSVTENWKMQKSLCELPSRLHHDPDHFLNIPVSSFKTGQSYKNIYCAACHDDLQNITYWNTESLCHPESQVSNLTQALQILGQPDCVLYVKPPPPPIAPTRCNPSDNRDCPQSYFDMATSAKDLDRRREIEWLCRVTAGMINIDNVSFDNPYCAACHLNETDVEAIISHEHGNCTKYKDSLSPKAPPLRFLIHGKKSFSVLLDVDFRSSKGNMVGVKERCPLGHIYDTFTSTCRLVFCTEPLVYHEGQCQTPSPQASPTELIKNKSKTVAEEKPRSAAVVMDCPKMRLERSEGIVNDNGTLTVNQRKLYPKGTFEQTDNDTIYVCIDISDNYVFNFKDDSHVYITIFCSSLSLVALLLKMITFVLMPEIRKFPDRLVFCLSVSLFIAQSLFLSTLSFTTNYPLCASVGVLTHYFFLCSFCWMNILAYDIWHTFSKCTESRSIHSDSMKHRFYCYSLYAWVTPMLIVSAACVFDWSGIVDETSVMRPHYGVIACWISTKTALLLYFAAPLSLLLFANIVFFILTAVNICGTSRATSVVQTKVNPHVTSHFCGSKLFISQSPHHLRFSLYVRLALIMGLTWISGFVAAYCDEQWLWHTFVLINASQGVYILLAFTPYRKVQQYLKRQMKPKRRNNYGRRAFFKVVGCDDSISSHRKLQRSSTRSSQTTTLSLSYSGHSHHAKAAVVVSNPG